MGKPKKEDKLKAVKEFCDDIRRKGGVEWRSAIIAEERKEYFRGKDLLRYCQAHPERLNGVVDTDRALDDQVEELCSLMLESHAVLACERFYKKPHPGRKHLVKFPRKLAPFGRDKQEWDADHFYCWLEDRPMPPWQYAVSVLMAVMVLAACLFPLAPYWLRISVVYFFLGLLGCIFALIILRFIIFSAVFMLSGYEFWLFPNLLSDQVDVIGAFVPAVSCGLPADGKAHWGTRAVTAAGAVAAVYLLYVYSPDEKSINLRKAHDSILDMFSGFADNPSLGSGQGGYQPPPQFGSDRNIDPEKIRQKMFQERQRRREEQARQQSDAEGREHTSDHTADGEAREQDL